MKLPNAMLGAMVMAAAMPVPTPLASSMWFRSTHPPLPDDEARKKRRKQQRASRKRNRR
jgi:hypothetical protein